jgi:hypothetical protein
MRNFNPVYVRFGSKAAQTISASRQRMSASPQKRTYARLHRDVRFVPVASFRTAANSNHIQGGPAGQIKGAADETVSQQLWLLVIICLRRCCEGLG